MYSKWKRNAIKYFIFGDIIYVSFLVQGRYFFNWICFAFVLTVCFLCEIIVPDSQQHCMKSFCSCADRFNLVIWWHDLLIMSVCLSLSFQRLYNLRISSDVLNTAGLTLAGTTYIPTLFQTLKKSDWLDHWRSTLIAQRYLRYCCQILTKCDEWFLALFSNVYINYIIGFRESILLKVGI